MAVSTNIEGAALLNNIPNGKQTIVVSYIGYEDKEVIYDFPRWRSSTRDKIKC